MKSIKTILLALAFILVTISGFAKGKNDSGFYLFGVSTSLTDSIVYMTDIQFLDEAKMSDLDFSKTVSRYSIQLQNYVSVMIDTKFQTAAVYFSKKKSLVEKDRKRVLNKFVKKNKMLHVSVPSEDFEFKYTPLVNPEDEE